MRLLKANECTLVGARKLQCFANDRNNDTWEECQKKTKKKQDAVDTYIKQALPEDESHPRRAKCLNAGLGEQASIVHISGAGIPILTYIPSV